LLKSINIMEVKEEKKIIKTLLIQLDSDYLKKLKIKAAEDGTNMKKMIVNALNKTYGL
jgi:hypothetical protein